VIEPVFPPPCADAKTAVREALRSPIAAPRLRSMVRRGDTVAISVCDGTRPQPREVVVPALLEELEGIVRPEDIVVLVATGTHRGNTSQELEAMFGADILGVVEVVNHDARDEGSLSWFGSTGSGVPIWLNHRWLEATVRVTTGFVEPHFFAGFSGGPKLVAPGLAGLPTVLELHNATRIGHRNATWGITEGNPVHDDVRAIAALTGVDFALDVLLDGHHRVIEAYAGELFAMHATACADAKRIAMSPVSSTFEAVFTSNAGFPLDQNLYQAVKGLSAAAQVVKPGGTIICMAECIDGFPDHGDFRRHLQSGPSPEALLAAIAARKQTQPDQWQVQVLASVMKKARVVMSTGHIPDEALAEAHLEQVSDVQRFADELPAEARICALPQGPVTIPYLV
jgi:nickel-dependent lactate racemase